MASTTAVAMAAATTAASPAVSVCRCSSRPAGVNAAIPATRVAAAAQAGKAGLVRQDRAGRVRSVQAMWASPVSHPRIAAARAVPVPVWVSRR